MIADVMHNGESRALVVTRNGRTLSKAERALVQAGWVAYAEAYDAGKTERNYRGFPRFLKQWLKKPANKTRGGTNLAVYAASPVDDPNDWAEIDVQTNP